MCYLSILFYLFLYFFLVCFFLSLISIFLTCSASFCIISQFFLSPQFSFPYTFSSSITVLVTVHKTDSFLPFFILHVVYNVILYLQAHTPLDYELNAFTTTVGNGYGEVFGVDPDDWQYNILSFSSSELYTMASTVLASLLKQS